MMLPSRHYESAFTRFLREVKAGKPELEREQQKGRAIWWDKDPRSLADRRKLDEGRVPQRPYVYQGPEGIDQGSDT